MVKSERSPEAIISQQCEILAIKLIRRGKAEEARVLINLQAWFADPANALSGDVA